MLEITDAVVVPVIIGLVEVAKKAGLPTRLVPVVDLVLGVAAGLIYIAPSDPKNAVFYGLMMGLTAAGLFSGVKNSLQKAGN